MSDYNIEEKPAGGSHPLDDIDNNPVSYDVNSYGNQGNPEMSDSRPIAKKNRTLQFYKFLFYSLKTEIKVHDFLSLVRTTNASEIALWILSILLYANTPKDFPKLKEGEESTSYKNIFIWFHLIHVLRAALGIFIVYKLPRSYQLVENVKTIPDTKLETTLFNDLIREQAVEIITNPIKARKTFIFIYFVLTFLNFIFDVIDFLVILCSLSDASSDSKVVFLTYMMIACLYITIDLAYIFWAGHLRYIFPKIY